MDDQSVNTDEFVGDADDSANNRYDASKFYTAARDKKGFATTARVSLPPSVLAGIGRFIAKQSIPEYRTTGDFFRDAIVHRLVWLEHNADNIEVSSLGRMLIVETESEKWLRIMELTKKTVDSFEASLRMAQGADRRRILGSIREEIRQTDNDSLRTGLADIISRYE